MSKDGRRLGRGIASLVSSDISGLPPSSTTPQGATSPVPNQPQSAAPTPQVNRLANLPVGSIRANPAQPRRSFDEDSLKTLADSLKRRGALQPIAVRPADGGYELVAGERRLRAAILAGLETIPAVIRPVKDEDLLELALIENLHRQDLNPVERALAYRSLSSRYGLTHEQIAEKMCEDRATVSNYIRILDLHEDALRLLAGGQLSMGQARALLGIADKQTQISLASRIAAEGWSVRQVEAEVAGRKAGPPKAEKPRPAIRPQVAEMEQRLRELLGAKVRIKEGRRRHTGRITIEYASLDDFERIVTQLGVAREPA